MYVDSICAREKSQVKKGVLQNLTSHLKTWVITLFIKLSPFQANWLSKDNELDVSQNYANICEKSS